MKTLLALAATTAALALAAGSANATVFLGDATATVNGTDPGLVVHATDLGTIALNLATVGSTQSVDLFTLWTDETTVNWGEDTVPKPISVQFTFTTPSGFGGVANGTTAGVISGFLGFNQEGYVNWNAPVDMNFGNGGVLRVSLNNTSFNKGAWWTGLDEGEKYGATITADFKLISGSVPEPATWAMMITGFGLVGATIRRRRSVAAAA